MIERIIFAAIKRPDNCIMYGKSHSDVINRIPRGLCSNVGQGFWTSNDRFVGREEAAKIAHNSGQIKDYRAGLGLISEMLWCARDGGKYDYDSKLGYVPKMKAKSREDK